MGLPGMTNPHGSTAFQASKETNKVALDAQFLERVALIGASLSEK
jgi:hypothetical protein